MSKVGLMTLFLSSSLFCLKFPSTPTSTTRQSTPLNPSLFYLGSVTVLEILVYRDNWSTSRKPFFRITFSPTVYTKICNLHVYFIRPRIFDQSFEPDFCLSLLTSTSTPKPSVCPPSSFRLLTRQRTSFGWSLPTARDLYQTGWLETPDSGPVTHQQKKVLSSPVPTGRSRTPSWVLSLESLLLRPTFSSPTLLLEGLWNTNPQNGVKTLDGVFGQ